MDGLPVDDDGKQPYQFIELGTAEADRLVAEHGLAIDEWAILVRKSRTS